MENLAELRRQTPVPARTLVAEAAPAGTLAGTPGSGTAPDSRGTAPGAGTAPGTPPGTRAGTRPAGTAAEEGTARRSGTAARSRDSRCRGCSTAAAAAVDGGC